MEDEDEGNDEVNLELDDAEAEEEAGAEEERVDVEMCRGILEWGLAKALGAGKSRTSTSSSSSLSTMTSGFAAVVPILPGVRAYLRKTAEASEAFLSLLRSSVMRLRLRIKMW